MKKTNILAVLSFLVVMVISGCSDNDKSGMIEESGILESKEVLLSSQVMGSIIDIRFEEGSKVKKGDTLMVINTDVYNTRLRQAMATEEIAKAKYDLAVKGARNEDLLQAEQLLKQSESVYKQSENDKNRFEKLWKSKTVTSKQYEDVVVKYDISKAQYISAKQNFEKMKHITRPEEMSIARAGYDQAKAQTEAAQQSLDDCFIISPIDGFITKTFQEEGEVVTVLSSLMKISDLSSIEADIYVTETEIGKVKLGQQAELTIDSYPNEIFTGKVIYISPEAEFTPKNIQTKDERTKLVFKVKTKISNKDYKLKSGIPADIRLITE